MIFTFVEVVDGVEVISEMEIPDQELESDARKARDAKLQETDWTQVPDAPVDQTAWRTYRQELRDIPLQEGFPTNIVWPTKPE